MKMKLNMLRGGVEFLKKAGIESKFAALINDLFFVSAKIVFTGVLESDRELLSEQEEDIFNNMPLNVPDSPKISVHNTNEKNQIQEKPADFRTCCVDFTRLNLLADDALVIKGAPISSDSAVTDMKNLSEATSGTVVVWGEIFDITTKETKNGALIAIIYFTDFTSSFSIKMIGSPKKGKFVRLNKDDLLQMLDKMKKGTSIIVGGEVEEDDFDW